MQVIGTLHSLISLPVLTFSLQYHRYAHVYAEREQTKSVPRFPVAVVTFSGGGIAVDIPVLALTVVPISKIVSPHLSSASPTSPYSPARVS